jgi:hypothetical protein
VIAAIRRRVGVWLLVAALIVLPSCATTPKLPPQAPPAVEVLVPVPVPCQIEQPPQPVYPADNLPADASLFDTVRTLLADRLVRIAETTRLRAAIADPCPIR